MQPTGTAGVVWKMPPVEPPHQHLPVELTVAAGWQTSSRPFLHQLCLESSDEVLSV